MNYDWEVARSLDIARALIGLGVPIFLAQPDPGEPTGYRLPGRWHEARTDPRVVDDWRPGMALGLVTGHVFDLVDIDPRSGGDIGPWLPRPYLAANTPSAGRHYFVRCLGVESRDGVYPGVDLKSGTPEGRGRGFAFIAPTVRVSKINGQARRYHWDRYVHPEPPDPDDQTGAVLRERVRMLRELGRAVTDAPRRLPRSVAQAEWSRALTRLVADLKYWAGHGWGGEAHAGLLAHTTHLARLAPEHAEAAYLDAFTAAGLDPDEADLTKLQSALDNAVPDVVLPDEDMDPQELFWAGAAVLDDPEDPADRRDRAALSANGWSEREATLIMTARRWRDAH